MKEIEIKILDIDRTSVEPKIIALGAKKVFDGEIQAIYFDTPDKAFDKGESLLRLRKVGEKVELVHKKSVEESIAKVREETEIIVDDFDKTKKLLEQLGLQVWRKVRKLRTSYHLGEIHFEFDKHLDNFSWIKEFLEIEAPDLQTVLDTAKKLGFEEKDCVGVSNISLHEHYGKDPDKYNM